MSLLCVWPTEFNYLFVQTWVRGCLVEQGQQTSGNIIEKNDTPSPTEDFEQFPNEGGASPPSVLMGPFVPLIWCSLTLERVTHRCPKEGRVLHSHSSSISYGLPVLTLAGEIWSFSDEGLESWNWGWKMGCGALYILYIPNDKQVLGLEVVVVWFVCVCVLVFGCFFKVHFALLHLLNPGI